MVQLTIEVPDELANRLKPVQMRLPDILELGLRQYLFGEYPLQSEIAEFLASSPSPQELIRFRPSHPVTERISELLEKNSKGHLTPEEQAELGQAESIDYLMTLIKAHARMRLTALS